MNDTMTLLKHEQKPHANPLRTALYSNLSQTRTIYTRTTHG